MSRTLPQNIDAEYQILATILILPEKIDEVCEVLSSEDFFDVANKEIFKAMVKCRTELLSINEVTVVDALKRNNSLTVNTQNTLYELDEHFISGDYLSGNLDLVRDASLKRQIIEGCNDVIEKGFNPELNALEYFDIFEKQMFELSKKRRTDKFSRLNDVLSVIKQRINQRNNTDILGLSTGYATLNKVTLGLQPEQLIIIAARPAMGKSAFAMNIAANIANDENKAIAIFSLEMSNEMIVNRMLSTAANIPAQRILTGDLTGSDIERFEGDLFKRLEALKIFFDDSSGTSINDIMSKCRKLATQENLGCVIIDYLQLVTASRGKYASRQEEVSYISRQLKVMARELKIPVIALSQLSRAVEMREGDKRPILADLRDSGSIEQDADIVLGLYRDDYYRKNDADVTPDEVEVILLKNRSGVSGQAVLFDFKRENFKFLDKGKIV